MFQAEHLASLHVAGLFVAVCICVCVCVTELLQI